MLKNLFTKLKSQKSSTINNENNFQQQPLQSLQNYSKNLSQQNKFQAQFYQALSHQLKQQVSQCHNIISKNQIQQVRYWKNEKIPQIFNKILACPISHYNLLPYSKRKVKQIDLTQHNFPEYLKFLKPLLIEELPTYNHILINHYPKGIGIMHHFDGPMYRSRVIVLSLGGPALISFSEDYSKKKQPIKLLLEDKSIHIFQKNAYQNFLHGIEDSKIDSFTFRIIKINQKKEGEQMNYFQNEERFIIQKNENKYAIFEGSITNLKALDSFKQLIRKNIEGLMFENSVQQRQSVKQEYCIQFDEFSNEHRLKGCFLYINQNYQNEEFQRMNVEQCNKNYFKMEVDTIQLSQEENKDKKNFKKDEKIMRWKVDIERQERISITIREKYLQKQTGKSY